MELNKQQDEWINENAFKNGFEITPSESINWVHWFNLESWSKENAIWLLCQINPHEPLENIPVTIKEISDQCPNSDKTPYEWMCLFDEFGIFELYASKAMKEHFALSTEIISNSCSIDQNKHNQEYSRTSINKDVNSREIKISNSVTGNAPIFPPDYLIIRQHLEEYTHFIYERLRVWTCDQASQVICNIDFYGFTQNHRDNFLATSKILRAEAIAGKIKANHHNAEITFKPKDIIEWAIQNEYKLSHEVKIWYEEYKNIPESVHLETISNSLSEPLQEISKETGRRNLQLDTICKIAVELGYSDLLALPEEAKKKIKTECLKNTTLFSDSGFEHAWKAANKDNLISIQNKKKYLK